jgi:hypothetical protein
MNFNFFGPSYDKTLEVSCIPRNKDDTIKKPNNSVRYIEKQYIQSVTMKVPNVTYETRGGYPTIDVKKHYVLKKHIDKIKGGDLVKVEVTYMDKNKNNTNAIQTGGGTYRTGTSFGKDNGYFVDYELKTSDGKTIEGISTGDGDYPGYSDCYGQNIFFIVEDNVSTGGFRRRNKRVTKRKRKMSRRSHHKKSRKSRK